MIEERLLAALDLIWRGSCTVKSGFARMNAEIIGMAASLQLITTRISDGLYGNEWQITAKGLRWINENSRTTQVTTINAD